MIELLLLLVSALNFFLALLFFSKGLKSITKFLFALFISGAALWPLSIALFRLTGSLELAYVFDKFIYTSGTLVPVSFLFFSYLFTRTKMPGKIISIFYLSIPIILLLFLYFSKTIVQDIQIGAIGKTVVLGSLYPLWMIYFSVYMAISTYWLWKEYLKSKGLAKMQLSYILLAIFFPVIGSFPFNIVLPFFGNYELVFIGPICLTVMVAIIAYAIIKHRLMDIRLVAARTVAYSLLLVFISICYAGTAFFISSVFLGSTVGTSNLIIYTALTVLVALSFDRIRFFFEDVTDKIFFRGIYHSDELLAKIGLIMSTNIELQPLTAQIIQVLIEQMRISKGAFVILGEEPGSIYEVVDIGFPQKLTVSYSQISTFFPFPQIIVFDELEETPLKSLMREMDISLVKTLKVKDAVIGLLLLGGKSSGEIYSDQDLKVLEILAPEMAVAIQNSQGYDKIKRFNVILSQEVKRATAELQEVNTRLKTIDQLKDDFVSIASHELRTPMTAIRSYAWMALHRSDVPLSKTLEKYIVRILISTERLINLVNDMLNVSRIESGRIEINPEPIDTLSLIRDIVDEVYYSKSEEKNIQFIVSEGPVPKVFADPEKLRQVLLNLVGNSLKFTPHGGKIRFDFFSDGKTVEISVSDTGVGIPKEDVSKLFHKFSRLDNSYTAAATSGGTGLGLYISKSLVELMHGRIWVKSEGLNKGTTFTVSLPVATPDTLQNAGMYRVKPKGEIKGLESVVL